MNLSPSFAPKSTATCIRSLRVDEIAKPLEDLAIQLARYLAVPMTDDALQQVIAAPVTKLEAALHYPDAERMYREGKFKESAAAFQRILLLEPDNPYVAMGRMRSLFQSGKYAEAIEAGQQALNHDFIPKQRRIKLELLILLGECYWHTENYERYIENC